jgi:hypothetical protein
LEEEFCLHYHIQEEDIDVDHVKDGNEAGRSLKGLIPERNKKILD